MTPFLLDAVAFLLRWLHIIAAIAWIGESFYFVMLDRTLSTPRTPSPGLAGESWSVHGGGFYLKQKFLPAPPQLPDELHWSKWKSYTTWLSGFALLAVVYLTAPGVWLIDPRVAALSPAAAVAWALALLVLGWLAYDLLCRVIGQRDAVLGPLIAVLVLLIAYASTQLFAGRAAFLLTGAVLATIMSANVFFVIIPGQKRMVAQLARGESPDPLPGLQGRQRSVHNTYLTLPVVFAMISVHYSVAHTHPWNWVILALFMTAGALIRQFFVLWHGGRRAWALPVAALLLIAGAFAWLAPASPPMPVGTPAAPSTGASTDAVLPPELLAEQPTTVALLPVIDRHCGGCHGSTPSLLPAAPKGILLDSAESLEQHADAIHQQTVVLRIMPPGNLTGMSEAERDAVRRWHGGQR
jgi:uncharacterized membrane protein